jgi:hypothetical protein
MLNHTIKIRAVKTGGSARFGPAHSGFGLSRIGLKSPDKKRAEKVWPGPGPVRAFEPAHIFFLLKKKKLLSKAQLFYMLLSIK